jgi:hypothetical protein
MSRELFGKRKEDSSGSVSIPRLSEAWACDVGTYVCLCVLYCLSRTDKIARA